MKSKNLALIYHLKAMILRELGGPKLILSNSFNVHAYQCFNSAYTIFEKQPNKATDQEIINDIQNCKACIQDLAKNDFIMAKIEVLGKFDTDYLGLKKLEMRTTISYDKRH